MAVSACLNLMRRMPPGDIRTNLSGLVILAPDSMDELLQRIDQPLEEATDPITGRQYLLCEYNRDADSYRSPWSNAYNPPLDDPYVLRDDLRKLEEDANELLDAYRELYYQGGISSVYLWDLEEDSSNGFAGAFLIKKNCGEGTGWESIHIVQISPKAGDSKRAVYKLNTTVMISVQGAEDAVGSTSLCGNISSAMEQVESFSSMNNHLVTIGKMIEKMEIDIRSNIDGVNIQKTRQILCEIRKVEGTKPSQGAAFTQQLNQAIGVHGVKKDSALVQQLNSMMLK